MKRKMVAMSMMVFLLAGTIYGCGKKEVDYDVEGKGKTESSSDGIAQFKDAEKWNEEWKMKATGTDSNTGEPINEVKMSINAEVIVPDVEFMSVIEAERTKIDEAFRKQFLESFFEERAIYKHDIEHYTKSELEKEIAKIEERQIEFQENINFMKDAVFEGAQDQIEGMEKQYQQSQELVQKMKEILHNATDEFTTVEETDAIGSGTDYAGKRGNIFCKVEFKDDAVLAEPMDGQYYGPQSLRDYDTVTQVEQKNKDEDNRNTMNECKYSMDEAEKLTEQFLKNIGRNHQICLQKQNLMWHGENKEKASGGAEENYAVYGYSFTYGTGRDGIAFSDYELVPDYLLVNNFSDFGEPIPEVFGGNGIEENGDSVTITVTDEGVIAISLETPVDIKNEAKQVELLPLDTVKDIMKNDVQEHSEKYGLSEENPFNRLELVYLKSKDNSGEGAFSYVPAWSLTNYIEDGFSFQKPIIVNAIDGSIIYPYDELN